MHGTLLAYTLHPHGSRYITAHACIEKGKAMCRTDTEVERIEVIKIRPDQLPLLEEGREKLVFVVHTDTDPMNPRTEYDCLGTIYHWHQRYNLGERIERWIDDHEEHLDDLKKKLAGLSD